MTAKGVTLNETCMRAQISRSTTRRCLDDLFELGALTFQIEGEEGAPRIKKGAGQPAQRWFLSAFMQDLFKRAAIDSHTLRVLSREVSAKKGDVPSLPGKKPRKAGTHTSNGQARTISQAKGRATSRAKGRSSPGGKGRQSRGRRRLAKRPIGKAKKKS